MENSGYLPNPLTSPALMVLASTAEASTRDGTRLPAPHPSFPGQSIVGDKDMVTPYTSSFPAMFRQGDHFPSHMYAPLPPFVRPGLGERGVGFINPAGGSAFRPVTSVTGDPAEGHFSAFTPAKRLKLDLEKGSRGALFRERVPVGEFADQRSECTSNRTSSPLVKEERPSSAGSAACETNSESPSEFGDLADRGTPDEGRTLRKQRKRSVLDGQTPCCPVCGITLRTGEVEPHYIMELEKLDKLSRNGKKYFRESTPQAKKSQLSPSASYGGRESPSLSEGIPNSRFETYIRIKSNRQNRLSSRSRSKKRRPDDAACPICNEKLSGSPEELNGHVEQCLKRRGESGEEEPVDVEGDGDQYEEYTWAGQTRIRATTLLPGGFSGFGFQTHNKRVTTEEDVDLNVDGDETDVYGEPQYSEADIIPCSSDEPGEDQARQALRGAVLQFRSTPTLENCPSAIDLSTTTSDASVNGVKDGKHLNTTSCESSASAGEIIQALRAKLKEREAEGKGDKFKCLICMESYSKPLASTQCWHVHCEECWLRTLGAKKLCPQCNMITSPAELRRIYL